MLFETIINKIKDIKSFQELSEYITSDFLYNRVEEFLKKIKLLINPKIILASFILKYEIENNLYYPYTNNVFNIVDEINKLHDGLIQDLEPEKISEIILNYSKSFKIWKEQDKKKIINDLKEDYIVLRKRYDSEKDSIVRESILLLIDNYKLKLLKLISEEEFNELKKSYVKDDENLQIQEDYIQQFKDNMKKTYNEYLISKLKDNDIEVLTRNLTELREFIMVCTKDETLLEEINDILYIEYLSDEELYKFLYNYCNLLLKIIDEESDVKSIKAVKKELDKNVSLDNEMYTFIPNILNDLFDIVELLIM